MPTDVIIDPSNGQIYWNDNSGTPQSISLGGNALDQINFTGYSAAFSPGSTVGGTSVLVRITDSALGTMVPGTTGNELGSATLRWALYGATSTFSTNSATLGTNSTSLLTGTVLVNGGIGISGSASVGGTVLLFNPTNTLYYVGLRASASLASTTVYTFPLSFPGAGTSFLTSDTTGILSWTGLPTTVPVGAASGSTTIYLTAINATSGSGLALSTNSSLYYNTANSQLVTPFLYSSNSAANEGGEIVLNYPSSGTAFTTTITIDIFQDRLRFFTTGGNNKGFYLDFATDSLPNAGKNIVGGSSSGTVNAGTANFAAYYATSTTAVSENANLQFTGTGISIGGNIPATSTTSGSLFVRGGAGIGNTLFVGGMIRLGTNTFTKSYSVGDIALDNGSTTDTPATTYYWNNNSNFGTDVFSDGVGSTRYRIVWNLNETGGREVLTVDQNATMRLYNTSGTNYFAIRYTGAGTTIYTLPTSSPQSAIGTSLLSSTIDGTMSWVGQVGNATTANSVNVNAASSGYLYALLTNSTTSSGVAVSYDVNFFVDTTNNVFFADGLALTGVAATTTSTSFNLVNDTATSISFAGAATALTIGNTANTATLINFAPTGTGQKQFSFGTAASLASTATFFGPVTANYLIMNTGSSGVLRIQTDQVNSRVRMFENMTTAGTLGFFGTSGGVLYLGTDSGTSNGDITIRGNFTNGGGGDQRAALFTLATATSNGTGLGGTIVFRTSTSATTGSVSNALRTRMRIEGAATATSNLESIIILGETSSGAAWSSYIRGVDASGTDVEAGEIQIQAGRSTGSGVARGISLYVSQSAIATSNLVNNASQIARFTGTGLTIYSLTNTTSATSGALVVAGGVGIGGSLFLGSQFTQTYTPILGAGLDHSVFLQSVPVATSVGAIVQIGLSGAWDGATAGFYNGSPNGTWLGISAATGNTSDFLNFQENGTSRFTVGAGGTTRVWATNNATSSTSGALIVSGGLGLAGNAFIGGTVNITNNTSSVGLGAGSLVNAGGFANAGNAFIGGTVNITSTNQGSYGSTASGALVVTGTAAVGSSLYVFSQIGVGGTLNYSVTGNPAYFSANTNSYSQVISHNINSGNSASADFIVSNNLATDTTYFGDFGMNSSGWAATTSAYNTANAVYLVSNTGDLAIGSLTANPIRFFYNNGLTDSVVMAAAGMSVLYGTNSTSTTTGALVVAGGFGLTGNAFIGGTVTISSNTVGVGTAFGSLVVQGAAGFGNSISVSRAVNFFTTGAGNTWVGLQAGSMVSSITYTLPLGPPGGTGTSVLSSTAAGIMSWVGMGGGSGTPSGNNTELQFNNSGAFGGATGITYNSSTYLVSIASTADQQAVTAIGLRLANNATVSSGGVQLRYSPALELVSKTILTPSTEYFNRFVTDVFGTISNYEAKQQWRYSYDTGTASYTQPLFEISAQNGIGIGGSNASFQNYFRTLSTQAADKLYTLPTDYPSGTGTSYLSASTTGAMAWVAAPTAAGGTPAGSTAQIQYNAGATFGGATGFEYKAGGVGATVAIFSSAGGGVTGGFYVHAISATSVRVGIGLSNPAYELEILGEISATNKSFVIDHPTKPNMKLRYGSLEGPENGVYVRGRLSGTNVIETPDHWVGLVDADTLTVNLTSIGSHQNLYVEKIEDYKVYVGTASTFEIDCFYSIWAERKDIPKLIVEY